MLIARVNGMTLSQYMKKHFWDPLGIANVTFHLKQQADMKARMPELNIRQGGSHPLFLTVAGPRGN